MPRGPGRRGGTLWGASRTIKAHYAADLCVPRADKSICFGFALCFSFFWFIFILIAHENCIWTATGRKVGVYKSVWVRGRRQLTSCLCDCCCCRWMASIVVNRAQIKIVSQSETETGTAYADDDEVIHMYSMYIPYCLVVRIYIYNVRPSSSIAKHRRISLFNFFQLPFSLLKFNAKP